jgi:FtsP/CotA-like multicopper oxidase with cupredoxin domain
MSIQGAKMTVVQLDGGQRIANAEVVDLIGILYPAERMDVIVHWEDGEQKSDAVLTVSLDNE